MKDFKLPKNRRTNRRAVDPEVAAAEEDVFDELSVALAESLKLQSHYATLLNQYDGGRRMTFQTVCSWLKRLREMKERA